MIWHYWKSISPRELMPVFVSDRSIPSSMFVDEVAGQGSAQNACPLRYNRASRMLDPRTGHFRSCRWWRKATKSWNKRDINSFMDAFFIIQLWIMKPYHFYCLYLIIYYGTVHKELFMIFNLSSKCQYQQTQQLSSQTRYTRRVSKFRGTFNTFLKCASYKPTYLQ